MAGFSRVSTDGGRVPKWSRDGREIFYQKRKEIWSVPVTTIPAFTAGRPQLLFKASFMLDGVWENSFDASADRKRFVMVRKPREEVLERRLVYVPNWADEVKQAYRGKR